MGPDVLCVWPDGYRHWASERFAVMQADRKANLIFLFCDLSKGDGLPKEAD